ncbi:MAG: type II 3-dehydroquinate dehydratase [Candidatus Izemoplasmatales bacterium]|jgi:3-dehydroquinate dehydratase-2|nr:3-dehydroquinate dehydratase [Candidatus Izemoplasmatales bacterium]MDD4595354.1 3-dehydroquinate dehydratase [Candidatus Izemoplasmatales bacterium]
MNILIINGPNLNLLGLREPQIYGTASYVDLCEQLLAYAKTINVTLDIRQSNHEGKIIDWIQDDWRKFDGLIINPGALSHYSYAIFDCLKAVPIPTIEVHLSDIEAREPFRRTSVIKDACIKQIKGLGFFGYIKAIDCFGKRDDIK